MATPVTPDQCITPDPQKCRGCGYEARYVYDAAAHGYALGKGHYQFEPIDPEAVDVTALAEELEAAIDHLRTDYPSEADMDLEYDALPHVTLWWDDDRNDERWTLYVDYTPNLHKPGPERWEGHIQWRRSMFTVDPVELASTILTDLS